MKLEVINEKHNLDNFSCEIETIDKYLKSRALNDNKQLLSKTYVVTEKGNVIAFCTLILHSLRDAEKEFFIDKDKCKEQRVPALLIGQIGVDKNFKGHGIGASLIKKMIKDAITINKYVHFPVIIIDAHKETLVSYYEEKGFTRFKDKGLRLFLPIADILKTCNN